MNVLSPSHNFLADRIPLLADILPIELQNAGVFQLLQLSLAEDLLASGDPEQLKDPILSGDVTSRATIPPQAVLFGRITAKAPGVIAGLPVGAAIFKIVDPAIRFQGLVEDGQAVEVGQAIAEVRGLGAAILIAERPALNFIGRLSGIASLTRIYVEAVVGTSAVILDTRKTAPGMRILDKYAVRKGGGANHRFGLYDMALVKDNHIDGAGGIQSAVAGIRSKSGNQFPIEVEVKDLDELRTALSLSLDRIMLDNMDLKTMKEAVRITDHRIPLEASGNVNLKTVRSIAETGVEFISVGALTHSAPALDISLRLR